MKEIKIEDLAYLLKHAKDENQPQPIFFLGAGASRSGRIPLAAEIIEQILRDYVSNPAIIRLPKEERTYAKLMDCLLPAQRDALLKRYIDEAKINVTHIYLAQLLKEGFVDYVLSVNFDNLMLRALALYNIFPATYDMAILKDLTTTTFKEKSVVYLHGQNHGLWLLNTPEEMEKVKAIVPRILDSIKNKRPWVFIGYSGEDPIFEHIKNLGRFDNGLYWITYKDNTPNEQVQKFLSTPNTNAFIIKGFDADSFLLKLNSELGLAQPNIVNKSFSALKDMLNEIVDIDEQDHFKGVKDRLEISKRQVEEAINNYELGTLASNGDQIKNSEIDLLKRDIINAIISDNYQDDLINQLEARAKGIEDENLQTNLSTLFYNWGIYLGNLAGQKAGEEAELLYIKSSEKYAQAISIKPDDYEAFYNWGNNLGNLADLKMAEESEKLYLESYEKYAQAISIKPDDHEVFNNWGNNLGNLAGQKAGEEAEILFTEAFEKYAQAIFIKSDDHEVYNNWGYDLGKFAVQKTGEEAERLYTEAFEKYAQAISIKPDHFEAFSNWGYDLGNLASQKTGKEAEHLFIKAFEKYARAISIKPDHYAFNNWGNDLGSLASQKTGKEAEHLYKEALEKYAQAISIKPDDHGVLDNWGSSLMKLAALRTGKERENLYIEAFEKLEQSFKLGGSCYNLACFHALKGNKKDALFYLDLSLKKHEILVSFVQEDSDWANYVEDPDFINILNQYK